ncbi:MAG: DegT/DnrJ/EryC1/StrS family aminotransferase [Oscillospiraceae bacterium]|nr:DegT/DnrJ/EryC1/StrS family aminotransferase [Oscillospiraceae bacterium]
MQVPFSPPDIGELEVQYVSEVLRSGWITTGPKTKELEKRLAEYYGKEKVACLNSATAAMELSLRILGVGPGDEVITSAYTYTASASVIDHVGAKIVLVDCLPDSVMIDPEAVASAINEKTKAVIPVDVAGIPVDYSGIHEAVEQKKDIFKPANEIQKQLGRVAIVADCAHSMGAVYKGKPVATYADFACFSFHAVKNYTTAEGGAAAFNSIGDYSSEEIYRQFMLLSLHGQTKDALAKTQVGAWEYDIVIPAYKCNMTDIMAAIGLAQLERYPGMLERRKELVDLYDRMIDHKVFETLVHMNDSYESSRHMYFVRVNGAGLEQRNEIIKKMAENGVSANVHYKPLPMLTAYKNLGFSIENYPNAYHRFENMITLPLFSRMTDEQVKFVVEQLSKAATEVVG